VKKFGLTLSPIVAASVFFALSGVAQSADSVEVLASNCPQPKVMGQKITEYQARDLAQQYADKNLKGFKIERSNKFGGGYQTVCYKNNKAYYSVEYSIDAKNAQGDTRILRVDQFGSVNEFRGPAAQTAAR
jgi:hypothetical protein